MREFALLILFGVSFSGTAFPSVAASPQRDTIPVIDADPVQVDHLLWDLEQLSIPPEAEWIDQSSSARGLGRERVRGLLYESVDYKGAPTQVFAWYSNPDLLMGRPSGNKQFPAVVLVHGGGGKAFKEWVEKWAAAGYAAIAMDLSGNGPDGQKIAHPGPDQRNENKFEAIETGPVKDVWTYHSVASILLAHSLLLSLPEVDTGKTCITGISWGGYLTCIAASLDNRFKAAVPVYGCGYYNESDIFSQPLSKLSPEMERKWMDYFDPSVYLPFAKPDFLFINGNKDKHYNVVPYHKTYRLVPSQQRTICIKPEMKHSHAWGWEPQEIGYFFESRVDKGAPLPEVEFLKIHDDTLTLSYKSPVSLFYAQFYYSNDTVSTNMERVWKVLNATVDGQTHTVTCPLPPEGFKYGFVYLKDHRHLSVSSEFLIR